MEPKEQGNRLPLQQAKNSHKPSLMKKKWREKLHLNPSSRRPENGTGFKMSTGVIYSLEIIIFPVSFMIILPLLFLCVAGGPKWVSEREEKERKETIKCN